jgi:adenylate kinase
VFTDHDCCFFRELVLLEAPLSTVLARRTQDTAKRRNIDPEIIKKEIAAERNTSRLLAERWGMLLHELPQNTGPLASQRLLELLR